MFSETYINVILSRIVINYVNLNEDLSCLKFKLIKDKVIVDIILN